MRIRQHFKAPSCQGEGVNRLSVTSTFGCPPASCLILDYRPLRRLHRGCWQGHLVSAAYMGCFLLRQHIAAAVLHTRFPPPPSCYINSTWHATSQRASYFLCRSSTMLAGALIAALVAIAAAADAPTTSADLVTPGDKYPMPTGLNSWATVLADVFVNKVWQCTLQRTSTPVLEHGGSDQCSLHPPILEIP